MLADMRKRVGAWALAAYISWDCGNFQLETLKLFSICLKYCRNFNHITLIVHPNAHLNPLKRNFSEKLLIIMKILSFQFAEISYSQETRPWKVWNFLHVCKLDGHNECVRGKVKKYNIKLRFCQ